jgi:N-acetylated-alpha-linked acidic dipeptidase
VSGASPEMEELRAMAELMKQGWKPKRTIIYAFWDGEEPGLLGSTEWGETHAQELQRHAAVYLNTDGNGRGYLNVEGSHTLENFVNEIAKDIEDPETHLTVWKRMRERNISRATPANRAESRSRTDIRIAALGSGSDYTVFLDHLGVASVNLGFGGEGTGGGQYHSVYDDFYYYSHFVDPTFLYGLALAQTVGTAVMRLADAEVLPLQFSDFSDTVRTYLTELKKLAADQRTEIEERNRDIDDGLYQATNDPQSPLLPPAKQPLPPFLNFAPLENAVDLLARAAEKYEASLARASEHPSSGVNAKLIDSERRLLSENGLPGRPWFKHVLYAPGFYTGYGVKTIPGAREAIEQKRWAEFETQLARAAKALENEADLIESAASQLNTGASK